MDSDNNSDDETGYFENRRFNYNHEENVRNTNYKEPSKVLYAGSDDERQIIFTGHGNNMISGMKDLREDGELFDLILKTKDGGIIHTHGCVLASHSPFVRAFLRNEDKNKAIDLSNWNYEIIQNLVDWMYNGVLKIQSSNYYELLESSDYLCLNSVSQECAAYICDYLTLENCCEAYIASCLHEIPKFKERVSEYILANFTQLLRGNHLVNLQKKDFLSFLKDDNLVLPNKYGFLVTPHEEEIYLFNLLKNNIDQNKSYELWEEILKDGLRFGLMDKKDLKLLLKSSDKWLGECIEKDLCLKYLNNLQSLVSSQSDLSTVNPLWIKPRIGLQALDTYWTQILAQDNNFPHEGSQVDFDDVTTILNELKDCDKPPLLYVTGMRLYTNQWDNHLVVSTIVVTYNNDKTVLHGNIRTDMNLHEFKLQPDERITSMDGRAGWLVDCLAFETNLGRKFGPFGGNDGTERNLKPERPNSYLVGLKGCVARCNGFTYIRKVKFAWASIKTKSNVVSNT